MSVLLASGAAVSSTNRRKKTALDLAKAKKDAAIIALLEEAMEDTDGDSDESI